jgi:hypothetical protein
MNPKNSQDLFNKIRSQFTNIRLGDENGAATADSESAVFFEFEFQEDSDTFGSVSVSIADGETMKVFYNRNLVDKIDEDSKGEWYAFLKELKDFAVEHQLRFDVRDITKNNLSKQDYENLADTNKTVNTDGMSEELNRITKLAGLEKAPVAEGLTGTSKSSFENLNKTRLIIRHKGKVDETVPGARSRQIQSLYIENEEGERFKYPMTHLAGARAMQRHVSNGGRPHDEFGQHIVQTSEDIAKLNSFSRFASNKDQLNDNASDIIEQTKMKLENLRTYMKNLGKQSHYAETSASFKTQDEVVLDDETVNKLREKFTLKNLDSRVEDAFPLINKIMDEFEATKEQPIEEFKDKDGKDMEPIDAPIQAPVDHGAVVQSFLTDPENKLILRKDASADKMLSATKFTDKNTMLGSILSDIASRLLTKSGEEDRVANFASRVADGIEQEGSNSFKPGPDYNSNKKIAVQLAKRYIDDYKKMQQDPAYADEVRMDPADFNPKKDIKGKAIGKETEAFESWVDETVNEYATPKDAEDKEAKLKTLQDLQMDPNTSKDPELQAEIQKRRQELGMQKEDDGKPIMRDPLDSEQAKNMQRDSDYLYLRGKEIDQGSIVYKMEDYSDLIFELQSANYADGTELDEKELEELESTEELIDWVRIDYVEESAEMGGVNENPETDYEGSMDYELSGDDGEMAHGTIHYKAINGVVDPNSLEGSYEYDGNHKIDDDIADEMIKPGGEEHEEALKAAQEDYDYEVGRMKSKFEDTGELSRLKELSGIKEEENQLEGLTFEDIKPYVSMYTDKDGKKVNAVLDKDGAEVFKTHDAKAAMAYLSQNYDKLKREDNAPDMVIRDPDDEADDKDQEIAKDQADAEKINTELDRIKHLANIQ